MSAPAAGAAPHGNRQRGRWAEDVACRHLGERGLALLARNYHCRAGEIDLVMRGGDTLVFVEVRYRARSDFGDGAESVGARKRARIVAAAQHYLQRRVGATEPPCRFDVVAVTGTGPAPGIEWITDAFDA